MAAIGPFAFLRTGTLLYAAALLPAAIITVHALTALDMPTTAAVLLVAFAYPALLLPSLDTPVRHAVLRSSTPARLLLALPAFFLGWVLLQVGIAESFRGWDGLFSWTRLAFGIAAATAGGLLLFWPTPRP